jgi:SAM-dependent methyltransferase
LKTKDQYGGYEHLEFVADFYDIEYDHVRTKDIEFFIDYSKKAGGRTLELGCGTGRVLIPTAMAGCAITGLDLSVFMLNKCREKLGRQTKDTQRRVKLIQGDMTNFKTGEKYSLVTIPFRPFQHLITVKKQKACLGCIHKHLVPKGKLIFDIYHPYPPRLIPNPEYSKEREDLPETLLPDGRKLRRTNRTAGFHRDRQYNDIELIYYVTYPDGRQERPVQSFPMRYYYRYEIEHLLELCDFKVVDLFGNFDRSEFSTDSPEMIFVAEKVG